MHAIERNDNARAIRGGSCPPGKSGSATSRGQRHACGSAELDDTSRLLSRSRTNDTEYAIAPSACEISTISRDIVRLIQHPSVSDQRAERGRDCHHDFMIPARADRSASVSARVPMVILSAPGLWGQGKGKTKMFFSFRAASMVVAGRGVITVTKFAALGNGSNPSCARPCTR